MRIGQQLIFSLSYKLSNLLLKLSVELVNGCIETGQIFLQQCECCVDNLGPLGDISPGTRIWAFCFF